jgi:hypothetical protein
MKGKVKNKVKAHSDSLSGTITHHQIFICQSWNPIMFVKESFRHLTKRLKNTWQPYKRKRTTPSIRTWSGKTNGCDSFFAEMGPDMSQFPTAAHLVSWARVCPGTPLLRY